MQNDEKPYYEHMLNRLILRFVKGSMALFWIVMCCILFYKIKCVVQVLFIKYSWGMITWTVCAIATACILGYLIDVYVIGKRSKHSDWRYSIQNMK